MNSSFGFSRRAPSTQIARAAPFPGLASPNTMPALAVRAEQLARLIYLLLVGGSVAFDKTFSHLHLTVRHQDLWITEIGMVAIASLLIARGLLSGRLFRRLTVVELMLIPFFGWGLLMMARRTAPLVPELHDFAVVYYCLFFIFVRELFYAWRQMISLAVVFFAGIAVIGALTVTELVTHHGERLLTGESRFLTGQAALEVTVAFCLLLASWRLVERKILLLISWIPLLVIVVLVQQRSLWIALLTSVIVMVLLDRGSRALPRLQVAAAIALIPLSALAVQFFLGGTRAGQYVVHTEHRIIVGLTSPLSDPTSSFRLSAWAEAFSRLRIHPLIGEGFGVPFSWHWNHLLIVNRPHNTFIWVAVNAGLIGLLLFAAFLVTVYVGAIRRLQSDRPLQQYAARLGVIGGLSAYLVFGGFNLLLESPYLAIGFWTLAGLATISGPTGPRSTQPHHLGSAAAVRQ